MRVFDASSIIYAWDNYPKDQFPPLWIWIASQVEAKELVMPNIALDEVNHKSPECADWLKDNNLRQLPINNDIAQEAKRIKELLGIAGDDYHPKGVDENDILIIATARLHGAELVSDEERQTNQPQVMSKRKIPSVCALPSVSVSCINFIDYIRASGAIFR